MARAIPLCVNCACKVEESHYALSMPLIRGAPILLTGGDKTGADRFYDTMIRLADRLYDDHLGELKKEGLIK